MKGGLIHRMAEGYKRWRHTRGYGVHSPFAYRLVTHVVRPLKGYCYYAEERLKRGATYCPSDPREVNRESRESLLLMRLAVELGIRSAYIAPGCPANFSEALKAAYSAVKLTSEIGEETSTDIICSDGIKPSFETLRSLITSDKVKALFLRNINNFDVDELYGSLKEGVYFKGVRSHLIVLHPGMQKLTYTLKI